MLPRTIEIRHKRVFLIDQTRIPYTLTQKEITSIQEMFDAIRTMVVRGAPAIGVSAAAGMALYIETLDGVDISSIQKQADTLKQARPTAVNLAWAIDRVVTTALSCKTTEGLKETIWNLVRDMADEDEAINRAMGRHGADLIPAEKRVSVITHCNAGSLATVYWGTALGVIRELHERGQLTMAYTDETRPRLQGGKISYWEFIEDQIPVTLLTDNMAAYMMAKGKIDMAVVGADRIAANGDTANKIGTYGLAIAAKYHQIPFYIAAPVSTFDLSLLTGASIPIEERDHEEVTHMNGQRIMPEGGEIINPAFDVTPAELITGIITENGVLFPPYNKSISF